jgi:heptosyltransferase-1
MQRKMPRILLVKTSSLGDVVHNLPVVGDISDHFPDAEIDWVVEESFAAIPRLHPRVGRITGVATRRWRRDMLHVETLRQCRTFLDRLREHEYDAVIDTQGLLKSALVTCAARGARYGLDWRSSREPLRIFYDRTFRVPWSQHAVERNRDLAAQVLGYPLTTPAAYGISAPRRTFSWLAAARYAVLLHATSADPKLWPEHYWLELSRYLLTNNIVSVLPWGNATERSRSERLAAAMCNAVVPPLLTLEDMAALLAPAHVVVGVDTGLTHLAAALRVPTVGIYRATDPAATGLYAHTCSANLGGVGLLPEVDDVIAAVEHLVVA